MKLKKQLYKDISYINKVPRLRLNCELENNCYNNMVDKLDSLIVKKIKDSKSNKR